MPNLLIFCHFSKWVFLWAYFDKISPFRSGPKTQIRANLSPLHLNLNRFNWSKWMAKNACPYSPLEVTDLCFFNWKIIMGGELSPPNLTLSLFLRHFGPSRLLFKGKIQGNDRSRPGSLPGDRVRRTRSPGYKVQKRKRQRARGGPEGPDECKAVFWLHLF